METALYRLIEGIKEVEDDAMHMWKNPRSYHVEDASRMLAELASSMRLLAEEVSEIINRRNE